MESRHRCVGSIERERQKGSSFAKHVLLRDSGMIFVAELLAFPRKGSADGWVCVCSGCDGGGGLVVSASVTLFAGRCGAALGLECLFHRTFAYRNYRMFECALFVERSFVVVERSAA